MEIGTCGGSPRKLIDRKRFESGLAKMVKRLNSHTIIVYGTAPDAIFGKYKAAGITVLQFDSDYMVAHRKVVSA